VTTDRRALTAEPSPDHGYRRLIPGPGQPHVQRHDLAQPSFTATHAEVLLTVAHLSDIHVCDSQSPARVEFLDRWADPDSPIVDTVGEVGTYRAQDMLTAQVAEACVRAVNALTSTPLGGDPLDLAIVTGDNTDNAHANELAWYVTLLEGGLVEPDSGDRSRYEGVADEVEFDERFWHPDCERDDLPRSRYGFPRVPGLLDAMRTPFRAQGLRVGWLAVHGNHDRLVQGTIPVAGVLGDIVGTAAVGASKLVSLPDLGLPETVAVLAGLSECDPRALAALAGGRARTVTADPARRPTTRAEFVAAHFGANARPSGHGFTPFNRTSGLAYYRYDHVPSDPHIDAARRGVVTVLVLDTVNEFGGWQGSLDTVQFDWLAAELAQADAERRYVVLASHHPLETLVNATPDPSGARVLGDELVALLAQHACVVLWLAGHTHEVAVTPGPGYWQVVAPSLIDWPQQSRIVQLRRANHQLQIVATMLDHAGVAPWDGSIASIEGIAGLSRELAVNDWQYLKYPVEQNPRTGPIDQRNVVLLLDDPWA
jgi:metallophosphoesterase (TIGR03767 family)